MNAKQLLKARNTAPACPGFDAWFRSVLMEALEPMQADVLYWMLAHGGTVRGDALATHFDTTATRIGSATSDLRALGLITSTPIPGPIRATLHRAAAWLVEAGDAK